MQKSIEDINSDKTKKRIKVLHFTVANTGGGITKFILRLWQHIDKRRFQFDFVTMSKHLDFAEQLEKDGCNIYYLSVYAEEDREKFANEVIEILKRGYDVIHLHTTWWRGFWIEELAKEVGISKIIVHAHSTDVYIKDNQLKGDARKLHYSYQKRLTKDIATDFWACAKDAAYWLYGDRIPEEMIKIVPNAIELDKFDYNEMTRRVYRERMSLSDKFVIGMIARFQYEKNHEFAIRFLKKMTYYVNNAVLLLIGIGDLEEEIKNLVKKNGLQDKVMFLGLRSDVAELLQAMDLFILPSRFEGLSIAAVEAQASGLKCIVSNLQTEEVKITDNIKLLDLCEEIWIEEALKYSKGYNRNSKRKELAEKGYDICTEIKKIEELYSDCGK